MSGDSRAASADGPLLVDLIGANQRMRDTLAMVFRGPVHGRCLLASGEDARAVVVNLDGVGAQTDWDRYRERHPDRPSIVLALDTRPVEHATAVVAKPVRIDQFVAALDAVHSQLSSAESAPQSRQQSKPATSPVVPFVVPPSAPVPAIPPAVANVPRAAPAAEDAPTQANHRSDARQPAVRDRWQRVCGSAPDCNLDDPAEAARRRFSGSARLLACARAAIETSRADGAPVHVRLRGQPVVTIDAGRDLVTTSFSDDQLAALCGSDLDDHLIDTAVAVESGNGARASIDALLWKLALWTYRGDLTPDAPLDDRVYLARWPNLTRLAATPNATRIAALLVRHPMQLARVAEALAIPQRHVFAFHAAASAIGLAGIARRDSDHLVAQLPPEPHSRRSLLGRLARHLPRDVQGDLPITPGMPR